MKCHLALVLAILAAMVWTAAGQGPDERYVEIYNLIQHADALGAHGQAADAVRKYMEAKSELTSFRSAHPNWNVNLVSYRLEYIENKLALLAQPLPGTNVLTATLEATLKPPTTNQIQELREEIGRLHAQNALLEAKLREALSAQPASLDPREFVKAQEAIGRLERERDLLAVSLEQAQARQVQRIDPAIALREQQILTDVQQKLAAQMERNAILEKENDTLKRELAQARQGPTTPSSDQAQLQLQAANATLASLQASNVVLHTERILLEDRLADLAKQLQAASRPGATAPASNPTEQELASLRARLQVYEAKRVPYSQEELALFKKPTVKLDVDPTNAPPRKVHELPPGAGPLMTKAKRAMERQRFDEAEEIYLQVLRQDEQNVLVLGNLAGVQLEQKRWEEAEKTLARALARDPRDWLCLYLSGRLKYHQAKYDEAFSALSLATQVRAGRSPGLLFPGPDLD